MQSDNIDFSSFNPEHIQGALALSQAEKWPHRAEDWELALELSLGVVALDSDGQVVGTILVTPYGTDCATINMVIVAKSMRGRGLGRILMEKAFDLAESRPLRLVATAEGLPLYKKLGFAAYGDILQFQGNVVEVTAPEGVEPASTADLDEIKKIDREAYGADRQALIEALNARGDFAVIRQDGAIKAYAALRAFGRGEVVGPVVATSLEEAKTLIAFFAAKRPQAFLRIDTAGDTGLDGWLAEIGLAHVGGGTAMRKPLKENAEQARTEIYALANQALG